MATFAAYWILVLLMQAAIAALLQRWLREIAAPLVAVSATTFGGIIAFATAVVLGKSSNFPLLVCVAYPLPGYVVALVTGAIVQKRRREPAPGCCQSCGYDLTGNVTGRCPECGRAVGAQ